MQPTPTSRPDLDCPEEIGALVRRFYGHVRHDALLGPVFVEQAAVEWEAHITKLTAFWCKLELGIPGFQGSPTARHSALSERTPFRAEQFERWVRLFHSTVDAGWRGPHAESIKDTATRIGLAQSRLVTGAEPWSPGFSPGEDRGRDAGGDR